MLSAMRHFKLVCVCVSHVFWGASNLSLGIASSSTHAVLNWACQWLEEEVNSIVSISLGGLEDLEDHTQDLANLYGMNKRARDIYLRRQDSLMANDIGGELVKLMVELCSGGREPEDEKLLKDWCELNSGAVWERGTFQASHAIPPEPVKKGTPFGLRFGAALNTMFVVALIWGILLRSCRTTSILGI